MYGSLSTPFLQTPTSEQEPSCEETTCGTRCHVRIHQCVILVLDVRHIAGWH